MNFPINVKYLIAFIMLIFRKIDLQGASLKKWTAKYLNYLFKTNLSYFISVTFFYPVLVVYALGW